MAIVRLRGAAASARRRRSSGGVGGPGGGGWGGPSYAVVLIGGATFTPVGSTLDFGNAGKNGDGAVASGNAGTMSTQ